MSIIRYRFKADKNFESVKIDGMSCSLGELKRLIAAKSSRSGTYHPKDDYDLIISNANTHEEYRDNSDLIPRNASVIVARRIRGIVDTLTPLSTQKPVVSSDDIVKDILLPAIFNQNQLTTGNSSSVVETNAIPLEKLTETTSNNGQAKEMTEDDLIKEIQMGSQARYVMPQPPYRTNLFVCHHCKQPGHIKSQCPSFSQTSNANSTGSTSNTSSTPGDNTQAGTSGPIRPSVPHSSHIVTRHAPYQMSYHPRGNRSHRGAGHPRGEPLPKKTTGIPRDRLIPISKHIPGALRDQTGASVVPRQMVELYMERLGKKEDTSAQTSRQNDDKSALPSYLSSNKSADEDLPPNDLLCPLCKRVYTDAVIAPCCSHSFCDSCIRTALIESPDHECPSCRTQHVAIDQINPNLFLRNHIKRWHESQNQSYYPQSTAPSSSVDQDSEATSINRSNSNETDEYDTAVLSTNSQPAISSAKAAPIIIKMQLKSQSPPLPVAANRPVDVPSESEKTVDSDPTVSSRKDFHTNDEIADSLPSSSMAENEKTEPETPLIQMTHSNTIYTSPTPATTMAPANPVVQHYYPAPPHHNIIYPHHVPPAAANGLYAMQPNYYPPPMGVRYPPAGIHPYQPYPPVQPVHHHHHPIPPPRPIVPSPHIPTNGYTMPGFHPHPTAPFTSTSTFIAHHQTATQPISTTLSENEFYTKQRYFQRMQGSPSRRRSRSSSYSSYSSSDSRSSSRSRHDRHRRSSRSRSRRRTKKSPSRDNRRQRRSSSYQSRRRPPPPPPADIKDKYSSSASKYRRSSPRPNRNYERRRSPRPPPTVQQSTQRTFVYMEESSHSSRDRRRSKSRSRGTDDRNNTSSSSSSKKEQQQQQQQPASQSSPAPTPTTTTPSIPTTLSSKIETVAEESSGKAQDESTKNGKKHKKHHKKHRHSSSKSKKRHRSKDKEKKTMIDSSSSVLEVQS
ncbi:unnamed protein product [Adineta ricciae]|uniref:E3 ubiquitin-protein ligase RBBP6 n=1 Tax=Adineta ricciae TaxID=249248 RepID=A0A813X2R7_ADIRI|nr:unnamed protein product [Adineta ricciae]